jgi:hypothetical protein
VCVTSLYMHTDNQQGAAIDDTNVFDDTSVVTLPIVSV